MNWHRHPELLDRLASDYALGTMTGGARRRFQAMLRTHVHVAQAAARWDERLSPMAALLPALDAGDALWAQIERRAFGGAGAAGTVGTAAPAAPAAPASAPTPRWWQRLLAPIPSGALAFGLLLGSVGPSLWQAAQPGRYDAQLPESYVGVLAAAQGGPGLIVSSLRRGTTVDLKVLKAVAVPAGAVLVLWTLDAKGLPAPVGVLPALAAGGFVSLALPRSVEDIFFRAVELAVSVEPAGATPAQPTQPYVYRGLCGKLWRVVPAPAPSLPPSK